METAYIRTEAIDDSKKSLSSQASLRAEAVLSRRELASEAPVAMRQRSVQGKQKKPIVTP